MCLFIIYCGIVLALLWIVHILCFVKQYDVSRHFSLTSNFVNTNNTEKVKCTCYMYLIICLCTNLNQSDTDWKVGYGIINPTASPSISHSASVWHIRYLKLALNSYILTPYAFKKTPIDFEIKGQSNKFLHSFLLIYTSKHFIF